jgi:hypothetical protein
LRTNADPLEALVDADLDTVAIALYVRADDLLKGSPERVPWRPAAGIAPQLSDAEMVTLAVLQALLGYASESRWLRHARRHLRLLFPYLPGQPGYNKRLRKLAGTIRWLTGMLARDTTLWTDDVWVVDSTRTPPRSNAAGQRRPPPLGAGRMGALRVLRQPFALVLEPAESREFSETEGFSPGTQGWVAAIARGVRGQPAGPHSIWFCRSRAPRWRSGSRSWGRVRTRRRGGAGRGRR